MPTVVGVRLRFAPKILYFDPRETAPEEGDPIIVETERGTEIGLLAIPAHQIEQSALPAPLKPVLRVATQDDIQHAEELGVLESDGMRVFRELTREHGLEMKPAAVEYLFDGDKVIFYFSAEERVDFRTLVRDLASRLKVRVDMRQIGVRDEARMVGGLGHCGEQLCCVRFPGEFHPVSIRMAKEQDLPLNPLKISGLCGRLMCCLRYEYEAYKDFKSRAPKRGSIVETPSGLGKVVELNTPREMVTLRLEGGGSMQVPLGSFECSKGTGCPCVVKREALEALDPGFLPVEAPAPAPAREKPAEERKSSRRRSRPKSGQSPAKDAGGQPAKQSGKKPTRDGNKRPTRDGSRQPAKDSGKQPAKDSDKQPAKDSSKPETDSASKSSGRRRRRRRRPSSGTSGESGGGST